MAKRANKELIINISFDVDEIKVGFFFIKLIFLGNVINNIKKRAKFAPTL